MISPLDRPVRICAPAQSFISGYSSSRSATLSTPAMEAACKKLKCEVRPYSRCQLIDLLEGLSRQDADTLLVEKLRDLAREGRSY